MPLLGLGCASGVRRSHVASALELGYRLFDTAQAYQRPAWVATGAYRHLRWGYHEDEVGDAIPLDLRAVAWPQSRLESTGGPGGLSAKCLGAECMP